jgi:hypothetical protein
MLNSLINPLGRFGGRFCLRGLPAWQAAAMVAFLRGRPACQVAPWAEIRLPPLSFPSSPHSEPTNSNGLALSASSSPSPATRAARRWSGGWHGDWSSARRPGVHWVPVCRIWSLHSCGVRLSISGLGGELGFSCSSWLWLSVVVEVVSA